MAGNPIVRGMRPHDSLSQGIGLGSTLTFCSNGQGDIWSPWTDGPQTSIKNSLRSVIDAEDYPHIWKVMDLMGNVCAPPGPRKWRTPMFLELGVKSPNNRPSIWPLCGQRPKPERWWPLFPYTPHWQNPKEDQEEETM